MSGRSGLLPLAVVTILAVAACAQGGTTPATSAGSVAPSSVGGGQTAAPSQAETETASPTTTASVAEVSPDAGGAGACALLSTDEVADALGVAVSVSQQDATTCIYEVPETFASAALIQLFTDNAAAWFDGWKSSSEATPVAGLGDAAVWLPAPEAVRLFVLQGDTGIAIAVGELGGVPVDGLGGRSPDDLVEMAKKLGALVSSRS
jgi:hypothetical protein